MKYLVNDYTYLYDDYKCTKKQFIKDNKDGYKWYVNGIKHTNKRINGKEYMVLFVKSPSGEQITKRIVWDDKAERRYGKHKYDTYGIWYVELITDINNLEEVC